MRAVAPAGLVPGVNGGMAELLLTDRATCIPVPEKLDSATAAAIGVVGTSADLSLRKAGIQDYQAFAREIIAAIPDRPSDRCGQ